MSLALDMHPAKHLLLQLNSLHRQRPSANPARILSAHEQVSFKDQPWANGPGSNACIIAKMDGRSAGAQGSNNALRTLMKKVQHRKVLLIGQNCKPIEYAACLEDAQNMWEDKTLTFRSMDAHLKSGDRASESSAPGRLAPAWQSDRFARQLQGVQSVAQTALRLQPTVDESCWAPATLTGSRGYFSAPWNGSADVMLAGDTSEVKGLYANNSSAAE